MKITNLKIEKLFGIEQLELDGKSVELTGSNGVGKSSVLDAIRLALTNNSKRKYIVKNGQKEGKIYVKLDDGTTIERKKRTDKSDYKSIKDGNGNDIASPESFLKDIFTPLQLEPVEFLSMSEQEQNRILLNLIKFDKDKKQFITEKFGEEINWVDYDNSILEILNEIQSKDGQYYQAREDINRNIRNEQAIITDIAKDIPEGYDVNKWRNFTLSEKYEELNKKKTFNENIDKSIAYKEDYDNKIKQIETTESNTLLQIEANKVEEKNKINTEIQDLKNRILLLEKELENVDTKYEKVIAEAKSQTAAEKAKLEENIKIANEWAAKTKEETETIENELKIAEEMKGHINEYDRMMEKKSHIDLLKEQSESLTNKIELARNLPGEILEEVEIPVKNLTVVDGVPLVNGIPVNGLSEGEKLDLCIDITLARESNLKLILIDGIEKMSNLNKERIYEKCREAGIQIISTRTTDDDGLVLIEL